MDQLNNSNEAGSVFGLRIDLARFLVEYIDTVPHLEALLLLREQPRDWTAAELSARLYQSTEAIRRIAEDLSLRGLIKSSVEAEEPAYRYAPNSPDKAKLIEELALAYRRDLFAITRIIHMKASRGVLEFARAFRFQKE
jgi:predicted ArsR family transcriptional regulator